MVNESETRPRRAAGWLITAIGGIVGGTAGGAAGIAASSAYVDAHPMRYEGFDGLGILMMAAAAGIVLGAGGGAALLLRLLRYERPVESAILFTIVGVILLAALGGLMVTAFPAMDDGLNLVVILIACPLVAAYVARRFVGRRG